MAVIPGLDSAAYQPHALHGDAAAWPQTNCYIDLWIEMLHALGLDPIALLPFCLAADFEGDQWTFVKPSLDDLWTLYGIDVQELNLFTSLAAHVEEQVGRGRLPLVEVDSFYLPDTQGIAYGIEHTKTTIGVNALDLAAERMEYFHNSALEGEDFRRVLRIGETVGDGALPPYVEFAKVDRRVVLPLAELRAASLPIARRHLSRRPTNNPFTRWRATFPADVESLLAQPVVAYHRYAFSTLRQFGAAFQLSAVYLRWLQTDGDQELSDAADAFDRISDGAKALLFKMARAVSNKKPLAYEALFDAMEADYHCAFSRLALVLERTPAA
jgi:hypothetical protein